MQISINTYYVLMRFEMSILHLEPFYVFTTAKLSRF